MQWISGVVAAAVLWLLLYNNLEWLASHLLQVAGISRINRLGEALFFFIYEVPKVLLLLTGVVFYDGGDPHLYLSRTNQGNAFRP